MIVITNEDNMELMARYPDKYFDLAIVDPPYGIERFKNVTTTPSSKDVHAKRFQRMETVNNDKPSDEYWSELFRVSKNQIVWGANNFQLPPSEYFLCWNKQQAMPNFATLEYAWVSMGLKKPAKLFTYSIHKHNKVDKVHPTQKPVALYKWLLDNYAKCSECGGSGEVASLTIDCDVQTCKKCKGNDFKVLDTHLGSGSIAIACHDYGFDLTACELDKEYFEAAMKRLKDHQKQLKLI
jgi:site-specific DNA-methyltransferase (adenine-specific)